jgi:hypothetical protein
LQGKILGAFRHVRNHPEQHDGFVEMIQEVVASGAGIDVGGAQHCAAPHRCGLFLAVSGDRIALVRQPLRSSVAVLATGVNMH